MKPRKPWRTIQAIPRRFKVRRAAGAVERASTAEGHEAFALLFSIALITLLAGVVGLAKGAPGRFVIFIAGASFLTACLGLTRELRQRR